MNGFDTKNQTPTKTYFFITRLHYFQDILKVLKKKQQQTKTVVSANSAMPLQYDTKKVLSNNQADSRETNFIFIFI